MKADPWTVLDVVAILVIAAVLIFGCAPLPAYYVTESIVGERPWNWASSTGNITKIITCHNTTATTGKADVYCDGEKYPDARLTVPAHDAVSFAHDVSARYSVGEACTCEAVK